MVQNFDGPVVLAGQLAPRKINMFELRPKNFKLTGFGVTKSYKNIKIIMSGVLKIIMFEPKVMEVWKMSLPFHEVIF